MSDDASRRREASRKRRAKRERPSDQDEDAPKRKKRKKRKKRREPEDEAPTEEGTEEAPPVEEDEPAGDRPLFARTYPRDERLDALLVAFEAGHFAAVREGTEKLFAKELPDDVMAAARDLRRRIEPSPTSIYLWAIGVALLALLYGYYVSHQH